MGTCKSSLIMHCNYSECMLSWISCSYWLVGYPMLHKQLIKFRLAGPLEGYLIKFVSVSRMFFTESYVIVVYINQSISQTRRHFSLVEDNGVVWCDRFLDISRSRNDVRRHFWNLATTIYCWSNILPFPEISAYKNSLAIERDEECPQMANQCL